MPRKITAQMKIRKDGKEYDDTLGYNNPVLLDCGTKQFLLRNYGNMPNAVVLDIGGQPGTFHIKDLVDINGSKVLIANLYMPPQFPMPVLQVVTEGSKGKYDKTYIRYGRQNVQNINGVDVVFEDLKSTPAVVVTTKKNQNINGVDVVFEDLKSTPAVVVTTKKNPSIPLTLIAIGCFGSGMLLVIFRTAYKMVRV